MDFNLDFLAEETLKLTEELYAKSQNKTEKQQQEKSYEETYSEVIPENGLDEGLKFSHSESDQYINELFDLVARSETKEFFGAQNLNSKLQGIPSTSGILYRIDNGISTFCLRGFACHNLRESFQELSDPNSLSFEKLNKILGTENENGDFDESQVRFFETADIALAEVLVDHMFRRRFPKDEESLCNLADPGFSWWYNRLENGFQIFFKSQGLERGQRYSQLGPMGDIHLAQKQFAVLQNMFGDNIDSELDGRSFKVSLTSGSSKLIDDLMSLLECGEYHFIQNDFNHILDGRESTSMYYYLRELAALRSFWSDIQRELI